MLRIRTVLGEELGILDLARFLGSLNGDTHPVRALKRHLQSMCGLSRFRQRLLFPGDDVCQDDDHTLRPGEVQVVLLNFCPASDVEAEALRDAARSGLTSVVETVLQRPQDPDLSDPAPLFEASKHGHLEVVCLLMEAKADKDKSTHRGCGILQLGMGSWRLHAFCWSPMRTSTKPNRAVSPLCTPQQRKGSWRLHAFFWSPLRTWTRKRMMVAPLFHCSSERALGGCASFAGSKCGQGQVRWLLPFVPCSSQRAV